MVRRGTYPLAKPNVGHEAKCSIRFAELVCVGAEEHFKHSDHVSCHFPAVITSAFFASPQAGIRLDPEL